MRKQLFTEAIKDENVHPAPQLATVCVHFLEIFVGREREFERVAVYYSSIHIYIYT